MAEVGLKKKIGKFEYLIVLSAPLAPEVVRTDTENQSNCH